jgi:hypothetical protein
MPALSRQFIPLIALALAIVSSCCKEPPASASRSAAASDPAAIVRMALSRHSISAPEIASLVTGTSEDGFPFARPEAFAGLSVEDRFAFMRLLIPHLAGAPSVCTSAYSLLTSMQTDCPPPDVKSWTDWINSHSPGSVWWY